MIKKLTTLLCLTSTLAMAQPARIDWENPSLVDWNKEKAHADFMLYTNTADAVSDKFTKSPFYQSLNGSWKFQYVDKYAQRMTDFYRTDLNDSGWEKYTRAL